LKRILADGIFLLHSIVAFTVLFGWIWPQFWYLYMATLAVAFISEWYLGCCFLSKWEFYLRKAMNKKIKYEYNFTAYYVYLFTGRTPNLHFIKRAALIFLGSSLAINLYFHFLY